MNSFHRTASVTVTRQRDGAREVFLARRAHDRPFLGGFSAFFAGSVEEGDELLAGSRQGTELAPFVGCAVRELEEEAQLVVDPDRLVPLGLWTTPEWISPNFLTHFFRVDLGPDEGDPIAAGLIEQEFIDGAWLTPDEALEQWKRGEIYLSTPIERILRGLVRGEEHPLPMSLPASQEYIEVVEGLRMLPLETPTLPPATHTNSLIVGMHRFVVVDPGSADPDQLSRLTEVIDDLLFAGGVFEAILLTHEHVDHIGGVLELKRRYGAPLWCHGETADRLPLEFYAERLLGDGDVLELGAAHRLICLHTPGHARGHLAFVHEPSKIVLAGDLVTSKGTIVINPPDGRMGEYLESLEKLLAMGPVALLPCHGTLITEPRGLLETYLSHRREREAMVEEALRRGRGPQTAMDLVPAVYTDVPIQVWPLAARSLLAHLEHLVERGVAIREDDKYVIASS
jgi:endoribonuclease LACTB2